MAIATAVSVILQASGLLNDAAQTLFTNTVMLPYLKIAFDELQIEMDGYQVPFEKKEAAPVTVNAGTTTMTVPADLIRPIALLERDVGSTTPEDYSEMDETNWDPLITPQRKLGFWAWVGSGFIFPAATTNRQVLLRYTAALTDLTTTPDVSVQVQRIHVFLQYRTAALAAELIMQDELRADRLNKAAEKSLDAVLRSAVRSRQAVPTRRRPFRYAWNRRLTRRIV